MNRIYRIFSGSRLSRNPGHPWCFESASRAAVSRPVYPVYPVCPCSLRKEYFIPGRQPGFEWSGEAAAALSRGRKPMEPDSPTPEPRRRRQQSPRLFDLKRAKARPAQSAPGSPPKKTTPGVSAGVRVEPRMRRQQVAVGGRPALPRAGPSFRSRTRTSLPSSLPFPLLPALPIPSSQRRSCSREAPAAVSRLRLPLPWSATNRGS